MNLTSLENEVRQQRAELGRLTELVTSLVRDNARLAFPKYLRPAITWSNEEEPGEGEEPTVENYPSSDVTSTFPIVFADGTWAKRSATVDGEADWQGGIWLPRETKCFVLEDRQKFLIVQAFPPADRYMAYVKKDFTAGESSLSFDEYFEIIGIAGPMNGRTYPDMTETTVANRFEWPGEDGWLAELQFDHQAQVWYLAQMFCDL